MNFYASGRTVLLAGCWLLCAALPLRAELPAEPIPRVLTLPAQYPDTWIYAHDINFSGIVDGKVVLLDVAAANRNYKGQIGAGQFASFIAAQSRPELYVAETYYTRRTRGGRIDVVTVYDKSTLSPIDEIPLPGGKRGQLVTLKNTMQLLAGESMLLVFNFTPAASVTVIDIVNRKVLNEIPVPGCSLIYPGAGYSFSSPCSDGVMLTTQLDKAGRIVSQSRSEVFIDVDQDPLFTKAGTIGGTAYFPSFLGNVRPVDFSAALPEFGQSWSLVSAAERERNWRPGGWQVISAHPQGLIYVLMQEGGYNGSHKNGGSEVWVFDVRTHKRTQRIALEHGGGISIEVTRGDPSYLAVINYNFDMDVYDPKNGKLLRTIGGGFAQSPFILHAD